MLLICAAYGEIVSFEIGSLIVAAFWIGDGCIGLVPKEFVLVRIKGLVAMSVLLLAETCALASF